MKHRLLISKSSDLILGQALLLLVTARSACRIGVWNTLLCRLPESSRDPEPKPTLATHSSQWSGYFIPMSQAERTTGP